MHLKPITPCLWFNGRAEEAVNLYQSLFPDSAIQFVSRYDENGAEFHREPAGSVMMIRFTLNGQPFSALNSTRAEFPFNESVSFQIECNTQEEIDHYWFGLIANGGSESMCGWLKDPFGVSWQVVPSMLGELMSNPEKAGRVSQAFMTMRRIIISDLVNA
jgi:predicted 3-demethylubiquinone-9 3-methyltransferase (glyoxalase superfamily)